MSYDNLLKDKPLFASAAGTLFERSLRQGETIVWVAFVLVLALPTLAWLVPAYRELPVFQSAMISRPDSDASSSAAWFGWLCAMIPVGVLSYGLSQVAVFLRRVRRGAGFTVEAASCVRRLGWSLLLASLLLPVARVLAIASIGRWIGLASLGGLMIPGTMVLALVSIGIGMLTVARVLRQAAALASENSQFV